VKFDDAWVRRKPHSVDGLEIAVIGRDDLLTNKLATGRPQDLADAERLSQLNVD